MNSERIASVRSRMSEERLDALVLRLPENILFLSGHWPLNGLSWLVFGASGRMTLIIPDHEASEAAEDHPDAKIITFRHGVLSAGDPAGRIASSLTAALAPLRPKRIGIEASFGSMAPPWNAAEPAIAPGDTVRILHECVGSAELVDSTPLIYAERAVKNAGEIDRFRRVNEIAAFALAAFASAVEPGRSGIEIVAAVETAALLEGTGYRGARRVRAFAQVAVGRDETAVGYRPMEITTLRRLAEGEWALLELAVVADGYWSDRTRLRCAGRPSADAAARFELVRRAQAAAVAAVHPGVTAGEVDRAAREVLREGGYVEEFLHVTGHGLGWRYHEPTPLIAPKETTVLREGMIHSVEPGIYRSDFGGFRIEDDVVVTGTGAEVLGPSPIAWE